MTHEKPAMPEETAPDEIWVETIYAENFTRWHSSRPVTKYVRADIASPKAEAVDVDAVRKDAVIWYDQNFNKGVVMPTDREVMYRYIDYLSAKGMLNTKGGNGG